MTKSAANFEAAYDAIPNVVRDLRLLRNLSVSQLARDSGLLRSSIDGIEQGRRRVDVIEAVHLARALSVDAVEFFTLLTRDVPSTAAAA